MTEVPHVDVTLNEKNIRENISKISSVIRPQWNTNSVILLPKSDGVINTNYICHSGNIKEGFFIRITNEKIEGHLERVIQVVKFLQEYDLSPNLLLTFSNGLVVDVVNGKPIKLYSMPKYLRGDRFNMFIEELARFHSTVSVDVCLEYDMGPTPQTEWLDYVQKAYDDGTIRPSVLRKLPTVEQIMDVKREIYTLLEDDNAEKCLCHGDPHLANHIVTGEPSRPTRMVDTDFTHVDFVVTDLAWMFQGLRTIVFWKKLDVFDFLRQYLLKKKQLQGEEDLEVSEEELQRLKRHYDLAVVWVTMKLFVLALLCRVVSPKVRFRWLNLQAGIIFYKKFRKQYRRLMGKEPGE